MTRTHGKTATAAQGGDALSALLETERTLKAKLDAAADEARQIVEQARVRAAAAESEFESVAAREIAALDLEHERSLREELARIGESARADAARFGNVSDARIRELAAQVVSRVIGA